ncbi:MAG: hypothetical protein ACRENP_08095 [Longimicrobiales bacterium]
MLPSVFEALLRRARRAAIAAPLFLTIACAGATIGSGVGDTLLESPPYYAGLLNADTSHIGHFSIAYQRGGSQDALFDPRAGSGSAVSRLLQEMNVFLDSLGLTRPIGPSPAGALAPDVRFSCETDASGDCVRSSTRGGSKTYMHLAVARPAGAWTTRAAATADSQGVGRLLLLTLEVGNHWPQQKNLLGAKQVELGTGYIVSLPWLTSLDDPVNVLQITGALIGRDGKAIRIGAEGMLARRSNLLESALGVQRVVSEEDVEQLRTARRTDLPDRPLVWQVALRQLVRGLMGGAI